MRAHCKHRQSSILSHPNGEPVPNKETHEKELLAPRNNSEKTDLPDIQEVSEKNTPGPSNSSLNCHYPSQIHSRRGNPITWEIFPKKFDLPDSQKNRSSSRRQR